jgi:hypothetical protein
MPVSAGFTPYQQEPRTLHMFSRKTIALVFAAAALNITVARAQGIAVFGTAEVDGNDQTLFLLGGAWHPNRLGWQPYVSAIGYNIRLDGGSTFDQSVFAPQVGLRYQNAVSAVQFGGGYAFTNNDVAFAGANIESGKTPFAAFQWNHWGTGVRSLEAIASYGFDTEFFWSRFTGLQRLAQASPLYVGAEAGVFGGGEGPSDFWTAQFGPAIEWRFTPAFRIGAAAGLKAGISSPAGVSRESDAYGRLSFLWLPGLK